MRSRDDIRRASDRAIHRCNARCRVAPSSRSATLLVADTMHVARCREHVAQADSRAPTRENCIARGIDVAPSCAPSDDCDTRHRTARAGRETSHNRLPTDNCKFLSHNTLRQRCLPDRRRLLWRQRGKIGHSILSLCTVGAQCCTAKSSMRAVAHRTFARARLAIAETMSFSERGARQSDVRTTNSAVTMRLSTLH